MNTFKQVPYLVLPPTCTAGKASSQSRRCLSQTTFTNMLQNFSQKSNQNVFKNLQTMINSLPVFLTLFQNWREKFLRGFTILYPSAWQVIPAWWHLSSLELFSLINRLQTWKAVAMLVFLAMFLCLKLQAAFLYCY